MTQRLPLQTKTKQSTEHTAGVGELEAELLGELIPRGTAEGGGTATAAHPDVEGLGAPTGNLQGTGRGWYKRSVTDEASCRYLRLLVVQFTEPKGRIH